MNVDGKKILCAARWSCAILVFSVYVLHSPLLWLTYYTFQSHMMEICENKDNPECRGKCCVEKNERDNTEKRDIPKIETRTPELLSFIVIDGTAPAVFSRKVPWISPESEVPLDGVSSQPIKPPKS